MSPISVPERAGLNPELLAGLQSTNFPPIGQHVHPTLLTPCWILHPCESSRNVSQLMKERLKEQTLNHSTDVQVRLSWLDAWLTVVCTTIRLDVGVTD